MWRGVSFVGLAHRPTDINHLVRAKEMQIHSEAIQLTFFEGWKRAVVVEFLNQSRMSCTDHPSSSSGPSLT